MVEVESKAWDGVVTGGELRGYRVEVRRQSFPWALYVLAFTPPEGPREPIIGFAIGRPQLAGHLDSLGVEVTWEDGRGPLAPERDRTPMRRRRSRTRRTPMRFQPMGLRAGFSSRVG